MQPIHLHPAPRRWWLVVGFAAVMMLSLALLGSGIAGPTAAAQGADPAEPTPELTPTVEAEPTSDPFPVTDTMTATMRVALDAYNQALDENRIAASGPIEITTRWTTIFMPIMRNTRQVSPPPPTPTSKPLGNPADMANTIWPAPSIRVVAGMTLEYEIRARNYGTGSASVNRVTLPFDKNQLTVETSRIPNMNDWVSESTSDHVTVDFNDVAPGELRKATIVFRVKSGLADGTVISMRATTSWSDDRAGGAWRSNWAPILAGKTNDSAAWVWLTVDPLGGYAGSNHRFFSDRFIPGEGIVTWLNTPTGVRALDLRGLADTYGRVTLDFRSTNLSPGTYSLVVFGARSNLTAIATFYVWPR